MTVQAQAPAHHVMRLVLIIGAALALVFSFALSASTTFAGESNTAYLHEPQIGTDSSETEDGECADSEAGPGEVEWHFILNQVDPGITEPIDGTFEFDSAGFINESSSKWNPGGDTHHFYVYTTGDDILLGAEANIGESTYGQFVLSHICHGEEATPTPTPTPEEPTPTPTPEGSQAGGTGTPAPSVPDTATSLPGLAGPLATVVFGLILLGSLGALAYANVSAVRRRN